MEKLLKSSGYISARPLLKGWSRDKKYILRKADGTRHLLRVSDASLFEKKREQFELLKGLEGLEMICSRPVDFGRLGDGSVYTVLTYLEGVDGAEAVRRADDAEAYRLGREAGKTLRLIHGLGIPKQERTWGERYRAKMPRKIQAMMDCPYSIPNRELVLDIYRESAAAMDARPVVLCHGDYHLGNMIVNSGHIGIIDFDKAGPADPYDELKPFCWNVMVSEYFETGLINGYFNDSVPDDFFPILKLYTAESLVSQLPWSVPFGEAEIRTALNVADLQMKWYDGFRLTVPTWYKREAP